jgi:carbamoyltransferase
MKIIGISGFDNSVAYKRKLWPGRDEREYRMVQGLDSAAALVVDGKCVAAVAEERIARSKHTGAFPVGAINSVLSMADLSIGEIDEFVHGFDYAPYERAYGLDEKSKDVFEHVYSRDAVAGQFRTHFSDFPAERLHHVGHHLAHAASAYFTSGWDECLVVVTDGMGEVQSISVYHAHDGRLDLMEQISANDSIGIFYSLVTFHLGFDFNSDEYKIMGLAPYGDPERFAPFFDNEVRLLGGGKTSIPMLRLNRTKEEREFYLASRRYLNEQLVPERKGDEDIGSEHTDVAAALQQRLNAASVHLCGHFAEKTGLRKLAMAGGVALNCTANGELMRTGLFDEIYIQPAAGDDGTAVGAALVRAAAASEVKNERWPVPFYGPSYGEADIAAAIREFQESVTAQDLVTLEAACRKAAELIAAGRVIAWYRGRMEFGPRALGHRSILGDPAHPDMRARINSMVKMREAFRPFAPAVSIEQVDKWFDVPANTALPYMTVIVNVREQYRDQLPAITHVDGSARVQTVASTDNGDFHALLCAIGTATGREMVLNTSFNVKGQAIVDTPRDAIDTFLGTGIEFLFLENTLLERSS